VKRNIRKLAALALIALLIVLCSGGCARRKPTKGVLRPTVSVTEASAARSEATTVNTPLSTTVPTLISTPTPSLTQMVTPASQATTPTATIAARPTATLSPPTVTSLPTPSIIQHTVASGETLYRIALKYRTTPAAILAANPAITDPNQLRVGTVLTIPAGSTVVETSAVARTHVVQAGETLYSIARKYDVSPEALAQANSLTNPNRIVPGQVLKIP
jgi:LysM repeat protein